MTFEVGAKYYTRKHGIATIKAWYKGRKYFRAIVEVNPAFINVSVKQGIPMMSVKYNELGDAVDPKNPAYDLMQRVKLVSNY